MEINTRRSAFDSLKKYDYLADEQDFMEVTEWTNKEGYDISISNKNNQKIISLTVGEFEAIDFLIKSLTYNEKI